MITVIFLPIKVKLYRYLQRSRLQRTQGECIFANLKNFECHNTQ
jgi:hypothetical protein